MKRSSIVVLAVVIMLVLSFGTAAQSTLTIAQGTDPSSLDSHVPSDSPAFTVIEHIVDTLFDLTADGDIVPLLVDTYEVSADGTLWHLHIRQGIEFHDGTPLNAEAVKFNLERVLDPDFGATFRFLINTISEIEVTDEYTVSLRTDVPFAPLLAHLTHSSLGIQSPTAIAEYGEDYGNEISVGTGPFKFESWQKGQTVTLVRNENYWGEQPAFERLVFRAVPEAGARMMMVQAGDVDVAVRVPPHDVPRLEADPNVNIISTPSLRTIYMGFNVTMEPFDNPLVRQAVNYAVDVDAIIEFILGGVARASDAPIAPAIFGYQPIYDYAYNPERAQELLAEAGFPDGFSTKIYSPSGRYMQDIQVVEAIQAMLSDVGIQAEIVTLEWNTYLATTGLPSDQSEAPMFLLGWGTVTGDADYGLYALFHSSQHVPVGSSRTFWGHERVDELLDLARTTPDPQLRVEAYEEAMTLIMEEAPWLFLHVESQLTAVRSNVEGLVVHPAERLIATGVTFE